LCKKIKLYTTLLIKFCYWNKPNRYYSWLVRNILTSIYPSSTQIKTKVYEHHFYTLMLKIQIKPYSITKLYLLKC